MTKYFVLAVAIQALIVLGVPAKRYYVEATGREVVLKIAPVDPYNPFGGYYEKLTYEISQPGNFPGHPEFNNGTKIFAIVEKTEDGTWKPVSLSASRPVGLPDNQVAIKGRYTSWEISYPIEQFYIPEKKRFEIDEYLQKNRATARMEIRVGKDGEAVIIRLRVGDRVYE